MQEIKRNNNSANTLIHYTKDELASSKECFRSFIELWTGINANITETDCKIAKRCLEDDAIKAKELEFAIMEAYKDPNRYGKVEFNDIYKHIKSKRDQYSNTGRANAGAYEVA